MPRGALVSVSILWLTLGQASAPQPATPAGCVKAARDLVVTRQRALKQVTPEAVHQIEIDKVAAAARCAAQFTVATVPEGELASLMALYDEAAQPALARAALDRARRSTTIPPLSRGEVLSQAVISGLREPTSAERNARLEACVDELDRLPVETLDFKIAAHARMNGYYRGDDADDGIIRHSTWLIETGRTFTAAQRAEYGATIVNAHLNLAEALAGRGQTERAQALLAAARSGWGDVRDADRLIDPVIARYALVGNTGAPIAASRWLNATAGTTMPMTGAVTLLEFTAHWCVPCEKSYPGVRRLLSKYGDRGFRVVFATELWGYFGAERPLAPDTEIARLRDYFANAGLSVPVAVADLRNAPVPGAGGTVAAPPPSNETAYEVGGYPQIYVIDRQGRIRLIMTGYDEANEPSLGALIEKLLKENYDATYPLRARTR